jgi:FkbM family methyltransferase
MLIKSALKSIASRLPERWQSELKRRQCSREIRKGTFQTDEVEFDLLAQWVSPGDWVLDIGANIGHYTAKLSKLVGPAGRVMAFEPVPDTFELLAANMMRHRYRNVTLINMAVSDLTLEVGMNIPKFDSGLNNYYMANLTTGASNLKVLTVSVDALRIEHPVGFVKIDAEGHELSVLKGMIGILTRDKPVLVIEDNSPEIAEFVESFGYSSRKQEDASSNRIFEPVKTSG